MKKENKRLAFLGMIIVALGIIVFAKWHPVYLWRLKYSIRGWWTLLIIIPSVISIFKSGLNSYNVAVCVVGILLLLFARNVISFYRVKKVVVPAALILLGGIIVFASRSRGR